MRNPVSGSLAARSDLAQRTVSGIVIALVASVPILVGGAWLAILTATAGAVMAWEFRRIQTAQTPAPAVQDTLYCAVPAVAAVLVWLGPLWLPVLVTVLAAAVHGVVDRAGRRLWRWSVPGLLVISGACIAFPALRAMEPTGLRVVLWIIAVVVATDIGAYAAGRSIGGPKLWPRVSPKKTWAGLAGGVLAATLAGALFSWLAPGTKLGLVCAVSAAAALVAQGGDLSESAVKRHFGVKDAGTLIPGHGGLLDRLDGMVAATLAVALSTWIHGKPVFLP